MLVSAGLLHTKLRKIKAGEYLAGSSSVKGFCDVAHHDDAVMSATVSSRL